MPTKTPLLRLLMCYLCGIWAGDALYFKEAPQITGIALAAVVACLLLFHIKRFTLQRRWLWQGERDVKRQQCLRAKTSDHRNNKTRNAADDAAYHRQQVPQICDDSIAHCRHRIANAITCRQRPL